MSTTAEKLTEDYINQASIRHARAAGRALAELAERAGALSKDVFADPAGAWAMADSMESLSHLIHVATSRLAKVETLYSLTEQD